MKHQGYFKRSTEHGLNAKGIPTKINTKPSGWTHNKNCQCAVCSIRRDIAEEQFEFGEHIAANWANSGAYSEEEIKKLTNSKIMNDFVRHASGIKDYPSPTKSPDFYEGAKTYLKGWLKYQKSHT